MCELNDCPFAFYVADSCVLSSNLFFYAQSTSTVISEQTHLEKGDEFSGLVVSLSHSSFLVDWVFTIGCHVLSAWITVLFLCVQILAYCGIVLSSYLDLSCYWRVLFTCTCALVSCVIVCLTYFRSNFLCGSLYPCLNSSVILYVSSSFLCDSLSFIMLDLTSFVVVLYPCLSSSVI